jgi:hypothetical protein
MREGDASHYSTESSSPPCTGCAFARTCGRDLLACPDFVAFVEKGRLDSRSPSRRPTRALFRVLFVTPHKPEGDRRYATTDRHRPRA